MDEYGGFGFAFSFHYFHELGSLLCGMARCQTDVNELTWDKNESLGDLDSLCMGQSLNTP